MKKTKFKTILTGALLAAAALLPNQSAQATLTYNPGDLFIGFHEGASTSYLLNIGDFSLYSQLNGASFTVNTGGNIALDLNSTFGADWINSGTVQWGAIGTSFSNLPDLNIIYASRQRSNPANKSTSWKGESNSGQTAWRSNVVALSNKYKLDGDSTGLSSSKATVQNGGDTGSGTYASFTKTSTDFGIGNIEGTFTIANGTSGSVLDLYRLDPVFDQTAVHLGKFTIDNAGIVTFTSSVAPVPEPSTYGLIIGAGLVFLIIFRRRRHAANS